LGGFRPNPRDFQKMLAAKVIRGHAVANSFAKALSDSQKEVHMGQRITDHRREVANGRMKHFTMLDKRQVGEAHHSAVRSLHQRPETRSSDQRLQHFLRIDRGWTA
jgi:hypothetical protein